MKKIAIIIAGVFALIAALAVYPLFLADGGENTPLAVTLEGVETEFTLSAPLPETNETSYPVYRTTVSAATLESVEEVAGVFGMTGKAEVANQRTGEVRVVDDSKGELMRLSMYPASGALLYEIPDRQFPDLVEERPSLPARDEAIKIADAFLTERGERSPGAVVNAVEVDQRQEVWEAGGSEPEEVYDVTLAVRYGRALSGLPVYGDEMAVIIGDGGEVVGMVKCWREVEAAGEVEIIRAEEAYEDLKAGRTIRPLEVPGDARVSIEEIALGYWMEPRTIEQETVVPVWVFSGTAYHDGSGESYQAYVKAVE
ncbi:hypothetical protein J2129_000455 [Methanofollis sp. W23]|uniref:calcium-dependent protein kinase n=1 Tax=Methanofollis sp. W23 TaxID=2817849 RepID=UPI001AE0ED12|nr:calcium-dependent protein kinase [Methanofollis sp. W23]MBP2145001.1 hypothetical protein [Methanofollis sp. W23]